MICIPNLPSLTCNCLHYSCTMIASLKVLRLRGKSLRSILPIVSRRPVLSSTARNVVPRRGTLIRTSRWEGYTLNCVRNLPILHRCLQHSNTKETLLITATWQWLNSCGQVACKNMQELPLTFCILHCLWLPNKAQVHEGGKGCVWT